MAKVTFTKGFQHRIDARRRVQFRAGCTYSNVDQGVAEAAVAAGAATIADGNSKTREE